MDRAFNQNECPVGTCPVGQDSQTAIEVLRTQLIGIKESVAKIEHHMDESSKRMSSWWISIFSVVIGIAIQTVFFVFFLGGMSRQVEIDANRIDALEQSIKHEKGV